jgi:hypothetical protein
LTLCRGKKRNESERERGGGHHAGSQHNRDDPRFCTGKKEKGEKGYRGWSQQQPEILLFTVLLKTGDSFDCLGSHLDVSEPSI